MNAIKKIVLGDNTSPDSYPTIIGLQPEWIPVAYKYDPNVRLIMTTLLMEDRAKPTIQIFCSLFSDSHPGDNEIFVGSINVSDLPPVTELPTGCLLGIIEGSQSQILDWMVFAISKWTVNKRIGVTGVTVTCEILDTLIGFTVPDFSS